MYYSFIMRLAITADWLVTDGGAERVLAEMRTLWPDAPIFTTVAKHGRPAPLASDVRTSFLQPWYRFLRAHRPLLPWMPLAAETWDLRGYDVIVSSSHAIAKGCIPPTGSVHICYCHTPMRYAWEMENEYLKDFRIRRPMRRYVKRKLFELRQWDIASAMRVDQFIANSREVAMRIERLYGRDCVVLPPPVNERFFQEDERQRTKDEGRRGFLAVGRLVPYKRFDLLIEAAKAAGFSLTIVGEGPEERRLRNLAMGSHVKILGHVSDEALPALYQNARALLFPVHEDAGVVPLEAMASGTPVIALGKGGTLDTIVEGITGIFFDEQTVPSLLNAIKRFEAMRFDPAVIRKHARQFSSVRFRERMNGIIENSLPPARDKK